MKYLYVKIIVIMWAVGLLLTACAPKWVLEYKPTSDMYAAFSKDKKLCELYANRKTLTLLGLGGMNNPEWSWNYTTCMSDHGWEKIKVFTAPVKKGR